ncbi:MAG TPA: membrane protein insertion efficiency factor YidD, partial [Candidatus Avichristensenella intestinipullorum]|nr:membrane protein insertion efficiency factor YidD [Candidatus Avichristensenella intestinipullorum]
MKRLLLKLIDFYQRELSPRHRPCCHYIPTCSEYAR